MNIMKISRASILTLLLLSSSYAFAEKTITFISVNDSDVNSLGLETSYEEGEFKSYKVYQLAASTVTKLKRMQSDELGDNPDLKLAVKTKILNEGLAPISKKLLLEITDPYEYQAYKTNIIKNKRELLLSKRYKVSGPKLLGGGIVGASSVGGLTLGTILKNKKILITSGIGFALGGILLHLEYKKASQNDKRYNDLRDYTENLENITELAFVQVSKDVQFSFNEIKKLFLTLPTNYSDAVTEALEYIQE